MSSIPPLEIPTDSPAIPSTDVEELPLARLSDLPDKLQQGAARANWSELMPVQSRAIPYLFSGRDMMIQSRTGSGKTGAFLLPMLEMLNPREAHTQALVLVPTRELAVQVAHEAAVLTGDTGLRSIAIYGGVGYGEQLAAFKAGAHIVIGTPGRILDHLLRRSLSLDGLRILIFDEADRMLSMGFYPDMRRVQSYLPKRKISGYMFSATFPPQVIRLADQFLRTPGFLNLSSDHIHVTEVEHVFYAIPGMDKDRSMIRIIEAENPQSALIFCNTRVRVDYVTTILQRYGYDADGLSSDLSQAAREKVLERVRKSELRFLVATDVAARGIDLPELSHVIQYEPPEDPESYIHRAGRTGRAGASGTAITLANMAEIGGLRAIGRRFEINLEERAIPGEEEVERIVAERAVALLEASLRSRDKLQTERMGRFLPLARALAENPDETGLLAMLLDDYYQEHFHAYTAPAERPERVSAAPRRDAVKSGSRRPRSRRSR